LICAISIESKRLLFPLERRNSMSKIKVYLKSGIVYEYGVSTPEKGREHCFKIMQEGYRHNDGKEFTWFGPHWIDKIKIDPAPSTSYPDKESGT
jgi:hypothetical protein